MPLLNFLSYLRWFYLSIKGRVGRAEYWLIFIIPSFILADAFGLSFSLDPDPAKRAGKIALGLLLQWPTIAVMAKRLHDRGITGTFALLAFVPILNLVAAVVIGVLPGTKTDNSYGPVTRTFRRAAR